MSYKVNRIVVSIITGIVIFAAYLLYANGDAAPADDDVKGWSMLILRYIVINIIALIAIQVIFHIVYAIGISVKSGCIDDENIERIIESSATEDEMDKLIESKSNLVGYVAMGLGFFAMLIGFAFFDLSIALALNIILAFFVIGSIMEGGVKIYFYQRGVRNG